MGRGILTIKVHIATYSLISLNPPFRIPIYYSLLFTNFIVDVQAIFCPQTKSY